MRKIIIGLLLVLTSVTWAQQSTTRYADVQSTTTSGTILSFSNGIAGMTASFEEIITGSPTSSSIVLKGCKVGAGTCLILETYTGNVTDVRGPALDKVYDYFTVTPTWSGGTSVTVKVAYLVTTARNGSGNGGGGPVTSVAGKSGAVTLVEGDITSLVADLAAKEVTTNKDVDGTMAANSDTKYPSQKAVRTYVASQLGGGFYQTIQTAGTPVTQRAKTNYLAEFTVTDNSGNGSSDLSINAIAESKVTGLVGDLTGKANVTHTHVESDVTSLVTDLSSKLPLAGGTMTGVITFAGSQTFPGTAASSHTHAASDIVSGVIAVARLGSGTASASTFLFGDQTYKATLPCSAMPTLAGDVTNTNCTITVGKLNGVSLAGLGTGIVKNTTGTGVPSIAVAGDFPTLNQNTSGNAATASALAATPTQCTGSTFAQGIAANGSANCATPAGSNPLTLLGSVYVGGTSGAPTELTAPTTPNGVTFVLTSTPNGSGATQAAWSISGVPVTTKTGTSYTVDTTMRTAMQLATNSTTATAVTTPTAASLGNNFVNVTCNLGSVVLTNTVTTPSKLNGVTAGNYKLAAYGGSGNPSCGHMWSDNTDFYAEVIVPTDANGRLAAAGMPSVSGDISNTAGSFSFTVQKLNGVALSGLATGIVKNTTATGVPSIAVAADFPTLNQSTTGNAATATAFDHTPTLGTTSQLCRGVDSSGACVVVSTLPTAMFPTLAGDVSNSGLTITVTKLNGVSLGGLATGLLKNTTTTGVPSIATVVDIDTLYTGTGKCYLFKGSTPGTNDGCDTPAGAGSVNAGVAGHVGYYATTSSAISDAGADLQFDGTHTWTLGSSGILDLAAGTVNAPGSAGFIPTADKRFGVNTTNHTFVFGSNGTTLVAAVAATGTSTATTCSSQVVTAISAIAVPTCSSIIASWLPAALSSSTSINGLNITSSSGTLAVANSKTFTASNTLTVTATDGLSINLSNALLGASLGAGVLHIAGSTQTATSSSVIGGDMANNTVTATQLAAQYSKGSCTEVWGGSGSSFALTSGDDAISNNTCYNDSGVTRTITAVKCRSSIASNTTTVNPTFGSAGTGTTILSGALTCGSSLAYSSSGTVSNASWTTGTGITPAMGGTLTGTSIAMIVEYTY
jgi:hypothetical protein